MSFLDFLEILLDALKDSALVFPFLTLTYIIIEFIDRRSNLLKNGKFLSGKAAPLFASAVGIFPQCGFSVMAAKLFDSGLIKVGTLLAVFIATSDEAFALLLTSGKPLELGLLLALKLLFAIIVGFSVNAVVKKTIMVRYRANVNFKHEEYCRQCGSSKKSKNAWQAYLFYPLLHALQTFLFVLVVNLAFGIIIFLVGEDTLAAFCESNIYIQPLVCSLVGLIPNCASSILLTQLYIKGGIAFGSMFAGLSANAGIGLAILLKNRKNVKKNLLIVLLLFALSVASGFAVNFAVSLFSIL